MKYRIGCDSWGMQPEALFLYLLRYPCFRNNVIFGGGGGTHKLYFENHTKNTPYDFDLLSLFLHIVYLHNNRISHSKTLCEGNAEFLGCKPGGTIGNHSTLKGNVIYRVYKLELR